MSKLDKRQAVIVFGDIVNGFRMFGPFADVEDAINYAYGLGPREKWTIMRINTPNWDAHYETTTYQQEQLP